MVIVTNSNKFLEDGMGIRKIIQHIRIFNFTFYFLENSENIT